LEERREAEFQAPRRRLYQQDAHRWGSQLDSRRQDVISVLHPQRPQSGRTKSLGAHMLARPFGSQSERRM
jgi:hypothetical protein